MFPHQFLIFHRHVAPAQTFCTVSHLIVQLKVVILHRDAGTADPRPVRADGRGGPPGKKVIMGLSIQEKVRKGAKFEYVYFPMNK